MAWSLRIVSLFLLKEHDLMSIALTYEPRTPVEITETPFPFSPAVPW